MTSDNDVLIINKQALIQAALELEKQETIQSFLLFHCLDQLEDIHRKLNLILQDTRTTIAKNAFRSLLMKDTDWEKILIDQQMADWEAEAQQQIENLP